MALTRIKLEQFTAFSKLDMELSPGINVLLGENGTGKTHVMKACYAACRSFLGETFFEQKLAEMFNPHRGALGRLVKRRMGRNKASLEVYRGKRKMQASFSNQESGQHAYVDYEYRWADGRLSTVYIPAGNPLTAGQWLKTLYQAVHERYGIYPDGLNCAPLDILDSAYLPPLRGTRDKELAALLDVLQKAVGGKVSLRNEELFLDCEQGNLEFSLLSGGVRKLALLLALARNGALRKGASLFWENPEASLNPKMAGVAVDALLRLHRMGVQIFFTTHDYTLLKELDLRVKESDVVMFHSFYRGEESGEIACRATARYDDIRPDAIGEALDDLYDRIITRSLGELG